MNLQTLTLILRTKTPMTDNPQKLRGYIGNCFKDYPILHHHSDGNRYNYSYPRVQYKIIEGTPIIVGVEEGAEILREISKDIKEIKIDYKDKSKIYTILEKQTIEKSQEFGQTDNSIQYSFITPWLALSQKNWDLYRVSTKKNRINLLKRILIGNILSVSKSLEYVVLEDIKVKTNLTETEVIQKGIKMPAFTGTFITNFLIPDYFGIGRSVSRGFGTVKGVSQR